MTIQHKQLQFKAVKAAGDGTPTANELALINGYALRELSADEVYVRRMYLAHNAIDRDSDSFSKGLLDDFARTLPGKGVFVKHPGGWDGDSGPGEGVFIAAEVVKMSIDEAKALLGEELEFLPGDEQALLLKATYFIPRIEGDAENKRLITKIDTGVIRFVSIGFTADHRQPFEAPGGKFLANVLHGPGEALEGSFVWLGAQPGARNAKALGNDQEEEDMSAEQIKALEAQVKTLKDDNAAAVQLAEENATKAKAFDGIKAVAGDLADDAKGMKAAIEAGNEYRKSLVDTIIAGKRHMKMLGDTPEEVATAEDFYKAMPLPMLKKEAEAYAKTATGGGSIQGSDPNTTGTQGEEQDGTKGAKAADAARSELAHL